MIEQKNNIRTKITKLNENTEQIYILSFKLACYFFIYEHATL